MSGGFRRALMAMILELMFNVFLSWLVVFCSVSFAEAPAPVALALLTIPLYVIFFRCLTLHIVVVPVFLILLSQLRAIVAAPALFLLSAASLYIGLRVNLAPEVAAAAFSWSDRFGAGLGWVVAISSMLAAILAVRLDHECAQPLQRPPG